MKLLFITPFLPHSQAPHAVAATVYQWLSRSSAYHKIDLVSFIDTPEEAAHRAELTTLCDQIHLIPRRFNRLALLYRLLRYPTTPKIHWAFRDLRMERLIRNQTTRVSYDLVQVEYSQMAQYGTAIQPQTSRLLVKHDTHTFIAWRAFQQARGLTRYYNWLEWQKLSRYEPETSRSFDVIVALSEKDRQALRGLLPDMPIKVISPGVTVPQRTASYDRPGRDVVFFGALSRQVNVESVLLFYNRVFPIIRQAMPSVHLHLVGGNPAPEIQALDQDSSVTVTGYLPDVSDYFSYCDVAIAPMHVAGGILTKVLIAMACGLPVVATSIANQGVSAHPGKQIILADTDQDFAAQVLNLLEASTLRREIGTAARRFIVDRFSWSENMGRWEALYQQLMDCHR